MDQSSISLRPAKFARVLGQDTPVSILQSMVAKSYYPRCILLVGSPGVGKTTIARLFGALVNCDLRTGLEPCGECTQCLTSPLIVEVEAATHRKVEDVDDIRQVVSYAVPVGKKRVVIIDEFHTISDTAQESLLHVLEAQSTDTIFVLTTTAQQKINDAILSRAFPVRLGDISFVDRCAIVRQYAVDFGLDLDARVIPHVARASYGLRSVWQLLDKLKVAVKEGQMIDLDIACRVLNLPSIAELDKLLGAGSFGVLYNVSQSLQEKGVEWLHFVEMLAEFAQSQVLLHEVGEIVPGAFEDLVVKTLWSKPVCLNFMRHLHELFQLSWKTGIAVLYGVMAPAPAVAVHAPRDTSALDKPFLPGTVDKLNADPVWALIGGFLGKRVLRAV